MLTSLQLSKRHPLFTWVFGIAGIIAIGVIDYYSGSELRVFPLYYAPVALLAWQFDRAGAYTAATLAAMSWVVFNYQAGMRFSSDTIWVANTIVQGISFLFVGFLIATLRSALAEARTLSRSDPLTRLRNSRAFTEDTVPMMALCRRAGRPINVAYIDLDNFKQVNDLEGHQAGDAVLCRVADAIRASVRPSDVCARLGGDEFAIVLPELGPREVAVALDRVLAAVNAATHNSHATASIGAACFVSAPDDIDELVRCADTLMYAAKSAGKNRVTLDVVEARTPQALPTRRVRASAGEALA